MKSSSKKQGRAARIAMAVVCSLAMVMTLSLSGAAFASGSDLGKTPGNPSEVLSFNGIEALQTDAFANGNTVEAPTLGDQDGFTASEVLSFNGEALQTEAFANGSAAEAPTLGDQDGFTASEVKASATYPSFNPGPTVPTAEAANAAQLSATKAGGSITVTFVGKDQQAFFESCNIVDSNIPKTSIDPAKTPPEGTVAFIPTDYEDSLGHTQGYYSYYDYTYSNNYTFNGPGFTYTNSFTKAGPIWVKIYYQAWVVKPNLIQDPATTDPAIQIVSPTQPLKWEADMTTRYVKQFNYDLLGQINYAEYERGKTFKTIWVKNGAVIPKLTPKRAGFKFGGWYTEWPKGSKVNVGSTKVSFGTGYTKNIFVHWKKTIKFVFNANKGKLKGKKSFKLTYLKKSPKAATASRSGYAWLGWYRKSGEKYNYYVKGQINNWDKATVTYKAQYIKKGKSKSISAAEFNRIVAAWKLGAKYVVTLKSAKAAIGGSGIYVADGYYGGLPAVKYEWSGSVEGSYVSIVFFKEGYYNNTIAQISRYGTLK